jgi:hypothetical protein
MVVVGVFLGGAQRGLKKRKGYWGGGAQREAKDISWVQGGGRGAQRIWGGGELESEGRDMSGPSSSSSPVLKPAPICRVSLCLLDISCGWSHTCSSSSKSRSSKLLRVVFAPAVQACTGGPADPSAKPAASLA